MRNKLYKYRKFDCDDKESVKRIKDIFQGNELYFSSPASFNDPFDCLVHLDFRRVNKDEFWLYYDKVLIKKTTLTPEERKNSFEDAYKSKDIERLFIDSLQRSFNNCGVYSLSSKNDDILMWSHYSDGHRGFCFEIDIEELKATKVKYKRQFPKFNLFEDDNILRILLFAKASHWKYEREWRYFSKMPGPIKIKNNTIKSVILGSQMDDNNRKNLIDIIKKSNHNPIIYEAIINKDNYSLNISKYET